MTYQVKQSDLPRQVWELIEAALRGETVIIQGEDNQALVQLLPMKGFFGRKAGSAKGKVRMSDDFDAPLPDFAEYMP